MFRHEDTRLTKLFVGGIPYDTEDEALRAHFEQFGPINEAVVIRDRDTLKSKGYGFVTFRDKDCAEKACVNKNPKIEGRTANVNLAYIGAKPKSSKGYGKNASSGYGFSCKQNTIMGSHQFPANYTNGFPAQLPAQQIPAVPLVSPLSQSPNGQIAPIQPTVQPLQLIEYNGVPTILFGVVYDHLNYYSSPTPYIPSPTLPVNAMAPSFTYQAVAPQTPPLNAGSLNGQHFFPTHVELIGQPQI